MNLNLSSLNENQAAAVLWGEGPLLVLAGPGSGKTRVLTYRIARLLSESSGERHKILGITFTNKAASEMRTRLESLVSSGRERALLTTFHSFAAEVLRQHGHHLGLRPDFAILSEEADREAVMTEAVALMSNEAAESIPSGFKPLPVLDKMLTQCATEEELKNWLGSHARAGVLTEMFRAYRAKLIEGNHLDFSSLIGLAVQLLENNQAIAKQFQRVYRFVCVDEFQDTNQTQFRLLCALVPRDRPNLFVVADDDQVIYQWNGANPKRLRELEERFSMETVQLPENYRCPPIVIDLANRLIAHNLDRAVNKEQLKAHKPASEQSDLRVIPFAEFNEEAQWIVSELRAISPTTRSDYAVLGRTKKLLDAVLAKCKEQDVPAHLTVRKSQFISAPVVWLHSALRLANARSDKEQLRRVCKAYYSLEGRDYRVDEIIASSSFFNGDYLRSWIENALLDLTTSNSTKLFLLSMKETLLERPDHWRFIDIAFAWLEALRGAHTVRDNAFDEFVEEKNVWALLQMEIIQQYGKDEVSLNTLLQEFDLRSKEPPPPEDSIRLLTIHSSKGLEFKRVYLLGLVEDQLPSWAAVKKGDQSLEMREERRNCFVAITRVEEALTITFSKRYFGYPKSPSRFLKEMGLVT